MQGPILLSVVTVTKNCRTTLDRTLQSVARIKTPGIEYVVVDGVSSDGTLDMLLDAGGLIDVMRSEPDTGIYNAMNKGVALARGEYVVFINGDDEFVGDGFPLVLETLAQRCHPIVCARTLVGDLNMPTEVLSAIPHRLFFFNSVPHPSSFVSRRLLLQWPFREDLRIVSDYDFFLRAYLARVPFHTLPVNTALHQRGGASGNTERSRNELEQVRRGRLGWRYPVVNALSRVYRYGKRLFRGGRDA